MFTTRPELAGTFGMVGSTHWLASQSAMAVLEDGGNAVDAAVAGAFVLHVVEPHLNGPGGDLPLILRRGDDEPVVLCGQGVAPAAATLEHFAGLDLDVVPGTGLLAPAVPGAVPAWLTLLRDYGTRSVGDVLRYAIGYAADGHPVHERVAATIARMGDYFAEHWPTSAATWLPHGRAPRAGELVTNPVLAETYRRLVAAAEAAGPDRETQCDAALAAWSQGFVAEAIGAFAAREVMDSSGARHRGLLSAEDLATWRPSYERPMSLDWRGSTVYKCGSWTQGPALLAQLAILDSLVPAHLADWDEAVLHAAIEAAKLAFADRDAWYGDGADISGLFDSAYVEHQRAQIGGTASLDLRPGRLDGREPRYAAAVRAVADEGSESLAGVGEPTRGDTCHLDVTDRWGLAVSATPSGGWLQSSPTIPELGFCLGTRMQMVWLEPDLPSSLVPGRRPRTTLSPSMAVGPDGVTTAFGTPGGDQQDQWQLVFWLAHRVLGRNLQEAIDTPAWHITSLVSSFEPRVWVPGGVEVEGRIPPSVVAGLRTRGHRVTVRDDWSLGRLSAVSHDPRTGILRGAANPRGQQGYAVGR